MRHVARLALVVTLLTAATPLIAGLIACEGMSCCADRDQRVTVVMTCCPAPSVSSAPATSAAKQRTIQTARQAVVVNRVAVSVAAPPARTHFVETPSSPPTRLRLAHLSTLLI